MEIPLIGKAKHPGRWIVGLITGGVLLVGASSVAILNRPNSAQELDRLTVVAQSKSLQVEITASGTVTPFQSVNLSPKNAGRIAKLFVEQGDRVKQGQRIALMENAELQAQFLQARANLQQATARLNDALAGSRPEDIVQARARVFQAQAQLAQARRGNRVQEINQARAQAFAAESRVALARTRAERYQSLASQGAVSQDQRDEAVTEFRNAQANLAEARQRLSLVEQGSRPEEIARLEAAVAESQAALKELENGRRPQEINQLKAEVEAARAQALGVQVQLRDSLLVAPFDGIVTQRYASEGAFVTPTTSASSSASASSTSVVAIARELEILADVPEVDIGRIKNGQSVNIVADAYPDQSFRGKVRLVAPEAVVEQNVTSFQVRIVLETGQEQLKSGMNVDVTFLGDSIPQALVIPTVAIVTEKGKTGVLVPDEKNQPKFKPVTIGSTIENETQIIEGIQAGDRVFIERPRNFRPQTEED